MTAPAQPVDPLALFRLDGKVAVVTGASSGIGARLAQVLDALGATVVLSARRMDRLTTLASSLQRGDAIACDVSQPGASAALVDAVVQRHGRIDVAVANAGITKPAPALREPVEQFAEVVNVDLIAPFELAQAACRHMREARQGGSVILVSSAVAFASSPLLPQAAYVAAKTGLIGLARELGLQWARYNVRVNALCPGMFPSEMTALVVESDELRTVVEAEIPMGRMGEVHELDGAVAFLASPASSYMTGQYLLVHGGGVE